VKDEAERKAYKRNEKNMCTMSVHNVYALANHSGVHLPWIHFNNTCESRVYDI
jgi:hypothetical protein